MCDSHTHWGARGRTWVLILATASIPPRCYYTQLCQLCVLVCVCSCVFLSLYLLFLSPSSLLSLSLTAGSPPRLAAGPWALHFFPLYILIQVHSRSLCTDVDATNTVLRGLFHIGSLCYLAAFIHPAFATVPISVQKSLTRVWVLSYILFISVCVWHCLPLLLLKQLGLPQHILVAWRMSLGWRELIFPQTPLLSFNSCILYILFLSLFPLIICRSPAHVPSGCWPLILPEWEHTHTHTDIDYRRLAIWPSDP